MEEEKDKYIYGVKSSIVEARKTLHNTNLSDEEKLNELKQSLISLKIQKYELMKRISDSGLSKEESDSIESKILSLQTEIEEIEESDIIKSSDVVEEVDYLLGKMRVLSRATSGREVSFLEIDTIEERIQYYKDLLMKLNSPDLGDRKVDLTRQLAEQEAELNRLKAERENAVVEVEEEVLDSFPEGDFISPAYYDYVNGLRYRIESRAAVIELSPYAHKAARSLHEELQAWRRELSILESQDRTPEEQEIYDRAMETIASRAREHEIAYLETKIDSREMILKFSGRGNKMHPQAIEELKAWKARLALLRNEDVKNPYTDHTIIKERMSHIERHTEKRENPDLETKIALQQEKVNSLKKDLAQVDSELVQEPAEKDEQIRIAHHRIQELEKIEEQKELFRINENDEVEVIYEPITPKVDWEKIEEKYKADVQDMLDKYYGNPEKERLYKKKMKQLKDHIKLVRYKYVDENGKQRIGVYETVEDYEGLEDDLKFLRLEDYPARLERKSKYEDGNRTVYQGVKRPNGEIIPADELIEEDKHYIETNNDAYNRLVSTKNNLMTLGKYGEKVDMTEYVEGQTGRNILRGVGNGLKWIRNHTTAPINKFIGTMIVSPIYGLVTGADDKEAGLYTNKRMHRYAARREYFQEQGKGFFASRWNAMVNYKEGNAAITSAGAYEIEQAARKNALDAALKEAAQKQVELKAKSIEDQILTLTEERDAADSEEAKEKLSRTIERLEQARVINLENGQKVDREEVTRDIQTDAIDSDTHDIANKENTTRVITGVKMAIRAGIHYIGVRKLKDVLLEKSTYEEEVVTGGETVHSRQWIEATQVPTQVPNEVTIPNTELSLGNIMGSNAGKTVEAYYSVYGGQRGARMMTLTGNEKITAIFQGIGNRGTGLSDTVGLKAPVLVDRTFGSDILDATGHVNQNLSLSTIMDAINSEAVNPETLEELYVSVGDRAWVKMTDLMQGLTKTIQRGMKTDYIDIPGHWEPYDYVTPVVKTMETRVNKAAVAALHTMGVTDDIIFGGLLADDVYENLRQTKTNVKGKKIRPRAYDEDYGFTGTKKDKETTDTIIMEEAEQDRENSKKAKPSDEGRE